MHHEAYFQGLPPKYINMAPFNTLSASLCSSSMPASAMTSASVTTFQSATDAHTQLSFADYPPQTPFPVLPSYEEATGFKDTARLPSYRKSRSAPHRYHPYALRWEPALADGTGLECLMVSPPPAFTAYLTMNHVLHCLCPEHNIRRRKSRRRPAAAAAAGAAACPAIGPHFTARAPCALRRPSRRRRRAGKRPRRGAARARHSRFCPARARHPRRGDGGIPGSVELPRRTPRAPSGSAMSS
ncbi:hypothetical protein HYPSUDRAFT_515036 [Hypholoma sublateritium FD-334 SS-4]|uniref:Uncharacterized protein n=1 Tax=Hypholoma sublateritium (strain FD-334 SS-4) TaxID=945553 RepID=A0A0D2PM28_HYPSF|nr:hypothetical protein HYPSUDRAFT_515036 [Hypholoma sublateritium FD-334 SS-4]